tara:strand:+ start:23 stop:643 length:621 start_codon:yes stop_codon:yes gene_type:complete
MIQKVLFNIKSYLSYRWSAVNAHGLHSPFLFDFYNEVISAQKEFYFFKRFRAILPAYSKGISERDALFLYRWAAFYKTDSVLLQEPNFPVALALSIPSSLKSLSVNSLDDYSDKEQNVLSSEGVLIQECIATTMFYCQTLTEQLISSFQDYECVIMQNPHQNKVKEEFWNKLCASKEVSISIDLFQFGILLFDKNQAKQHFVVKMS